jgi:hypothetical protein
VIDLINECFLVCQELGELSRSGRILDQISFNTAKPRFKSCLSSHANLLYKITWTWPTSAVILHSHSSTHTHTHTSVESVSDCGGTQFRHPTSVIPSGAHFMKKIHSLGHLNDVNHALIFALMLRFWCTFFTSASLAGARLRQTSLRTLSDYGNLSRIYL